MDKEFENKELEKVLNEVNNNFSKKVYLWKGKEKELFLNIYSEGKYVEFLGPYKKTARTMKELIPIFEFMKKYGYTSNLE